MPHITSLTPIAEQKALCRTLDYMLQSTNAQDWAELEFQKAIAEGLLGLIHRQYNIEIYGQYAHAVNTVLTVCEGYREMWMRERT